MIGARSARRPPPRHALPPSGRSGRRSGGRRPVGTNLVLYAVLVLLSGFVVGTTATFNATTRNAGNSFTTAAITQPTAPAAPGSHLTGTSAQVRWTAPTANPAANGGIGYRIRRAYAGGPTDTAGTSPGCGSGALSYSTVGFSSTSTYSDATIPTAAADQGTHYCYQTESVWPCCPVDGKKPVITSINTAGRVIQDVQTGYVVSSWEFLGNGNGQAATGEQLRVKFNQPVDVANSITTSETVCIHKGDRTIRVGSSLTTPSDCERTTTYERQRFQFSSNSTAGSWTIEFPAPVSCTATIPWAGSSGNTEAALAGPLNTCLGAGNYVVNAGGCSKCTIDLDYRGRWNGDMPLPTFTSSLVNNGTPVTISGLDNTIVPLWGSIGTIITTAGGWGGDAEARFTIGALDWTDCSVAGVACMTLTITLGPPAGGSTKVINMPTVASWTLTPAGGRLSQSYTESLPLCTTNPAGAPTGGLCLVTNSSGW